MAGEIILKDFYYIYITSIYSPFSSKIPEKRDAQVLALF